MAAKRETVVAEDLTQQSGAFEKSDPKRAEKLLREALSKDIFYGPAHNNLGVIFLGNGRLYEAAQEFEWARKLLPGNPDPRVNLALTLERAGRLDEAFKTYETALEVAPECLAAIEGAASLAVRTGKDEARLPSWLHSIAMQGADPWPHWAREQALRNTK